MLKKVWEVSGSLKRIKYITVSSVIWTILLVLFLFDLVQDIRTFSDVFQFIIMLIILGAIWYLDVRFNPFVFQNLRKVNVKESVNSSINYAKQGYRQENTLEEGIEHGAINGLEKGTKSFILKPVLSWILWPFSVIVALCTTNKWIDIDYQENENKKNNTADTAKNFVVSNSQELTDAISKITPNSVITLKAGHYVFTSKYSAVKTVKIIGESRDNTFLQLGTALQTQINSVLTIENLSISREEDYGDHPIIGLVGNNSKLIINNCKIENSNNEEPMVIGQSKNSYLEVNNVTTTRLPKKTAYDIAVIYDTVVKIENSSIQCVEALDKARLNADNSQFTMVVTQNKSMITLTNCTIINGFLGGNDSTININNSVCDFVYTGNYSMELFDNAKLNISSSIINSKNGEQLRCQLNDQSKLELSLINYTVKKPLFVECNDLKTQLINPQNVPIQTKASTSSSVASSQNN